MIARFVLTPTGKKIHVTHDVLCSTTRCGQSVLTEADADMVAWRWPPCSRCINPEAW